AYVRLAAALGAARGPQDPPRAAAKHLSSRRSFPGVSFCRIGECEIVEPSFNFLAEELQVCEIEERIPVLCVLLMPTWARHNSDQVAGAQEVEDFFGGGVTLLRTLGIGPPVFERFGAEQGTRGDECLDRVLIERQAVDLADEIGEVRSEPE